MLPERQTVGFPANMPGVLLSVAPIVPAAMPPFLSVGRRRSWTAPAVDIVSIEAFG